MDNKSLLCDEELLVSPPPTFYHTQLDRSLDMQVGSFYFYTTRADRDRALGVCMQRETCYMPQHGYVEHLWSSHLVGVRLRAVRWMIKTQCRLNLLLGAVFDAMNYFDRYISVNRCMEWKYWMIELLSVACLSLAAKSNEVSIPPLSDFQVDDLYHSFQPSDIQRMELTVMKALGWRLSCITPYSYVDLLTWNLDSLHVGLTARITELLLGVLLDPKLIIFRPCTIAVAALRCSLEELLPSKSDAHLSDLTLVLPIDQTDEMNKCHEMMEKSIADPLYSLMSSDHPYCPSSPVTVMALDETHIFNCYIDFTLLRPSSNPKKRKRSNLCK